MQKQILELVLSAFVSNPNVGIFYATSDGQCFEKQSLAKLHAQTLSDDKVAPFTQSLAEKQLANKETEPETPVQETKKLSLDERLKAVDTASSIEELDVLLKDETAKTVKSAIADKIEALTTANLIQSITAVETVEALDKVLEGQDNEEVKAAGEKKRAELTQE
jgi:hypothetical protein